MTRTDPFDLHTSEESAPPRVAHHHNLRLPEADYQEFRRRAYANGTNITAEILAAYRGQREPLPVEVSHD